MFFLPKRHDKGVVFLKQASAVSVIPVKTGIQIVMRWIPACAGMTSGEVLLKKILIIIVCFKFHPTFFAQPAGVFVNYENRFIQGV